MPVLARLASLVLNRHHHITPDAAEVILDVLAGRIGIDAVVRAGAVAPPEPQASGFVGRPVVDKDSGRWRGYRVTDRGVAIVPVLGELVNRGAWVGASSGLVSYDGLSHSLRNAAADREVRAIVLDVESPGGMAAGMIETAALVRSVAETKPVIAVANGLMASAAYGISSGATRIIATPTSTVGSIGTLFVHADQSRKLDKAGITVTLIRAGARKVEANPFEPLSPGVRAELARQNEEFQTMFVEAVALGRRGAIDEAAIRRTEAATYRGGEARDLGLADEIGTFDDAVAEAERARVSPRPVPKAAPSPGPASPAPAPSPAPAEAGASTRAKSMTDTQEAAGGWEGMTLADLNAAVDAMRQAIGAPPAPAATTATAPPPPPVPVQRAETAAEAHARGRTEATERIRAILGHPEAAARQAQARVIALESDLPVEAAAKILAAAPKETPATTTAAEFYKAAARTGGTPRVPHDGAHQLQQEPQGSGMLARHTARVASRFGKPATAALSKGA